VSAAPVDLLVLGGGPGGYTAAFRAADLGLGVVLVESHSRLGGVCTNVGCIPSKALLHAARVLGEAEEARALGITFAAPSVDLAALREATEAVVTRLTKGLAGLAKQRAVRVVRGTGRFTSPHELTVETPEGPEAIAFSHAIVAVGSEPARIPFMPDDPRVIDSTGALALADVPQRLLVVGGGIIGLEMATVYDALGARITVVEMLDQIIPGCDPDLVKPLGSRIEKRYEAIHLGTRVAAVEAREDGLRASFEGDDAPEPQTFDRVLVAVGRRARGREIDAQAAGVEVDERGVIAVDRQMRTSAPHIHAIGDVVGEPMLAHKATHQGLVAAETIAGRASAFDPRTIPSVAYTDPEIAWMGLTETEAKASGVAHEVAVFPWAASGRALTMGRSDGLTKLIVDPSTRRILGAGIVGVNAGELIAEAVHALEMGSDAEDLALTIHPHPTLSETLGFAAEVAEGTITDLYLGKRRTKAG
jgi:dihydrolipoamide dehydrogenase